MNDYYLVVGCARSGIAVTKFLLNKGKKVILTDTKKQDIIFNQYPELTQIKNDNIIYIFGEQPEAKILEMVKEIIISPGVPLTIPILSEAKKKNINIISEIELAYRYSKAPIIAITGTNGKTTTTSLTGQIFKMSGRRTFVVGNIGDPIINYVDEAKEDDVFVAEISSFQLETINEFRPLISTILNITPDHLDRHKTMDNYISAKSRIFMNQDNSDYLVVNCDDNIIMDNTENVKCNKIYFSIKNKVEKGAYLDNDIIKIVDNTKTIEVCSIQDLKIPGMHNVKNALAAITMSYFGGVDIESIKKALKSFLGVEHRLEFVRNINGIKFYNDSKGTNTDATIIALKAMTDPIILIAGGYDKNGKFDELIDKFDGKVKHLIVLGQTAEKIINTAINYNYKNLTRVKSYKEAVEKSYEYAKDGDVVLLSPACASWDMFKDFEERGELFKELVNELGEAN